MKALARTGDILQKMGWKKVPLTTFRLNNILTEYIFDLSPIEEISSFEPYDYKSGIRRTVKWMREVGKI